MMKKIFLAFAFLIISPCHAMQWQPQPARGVKTLYESAAKAMIQQLFKKKHSYMAGEIGKFSDDQKEFIKDILYKSHPLF